MPNGGRGAAARVLLVHDRGAEGIDSLHYAKGVDAYVIHLGAGLPAAGRAAGSREFTIPAGLMERLCWLVAVAMEHDDVRATPEHCRVPPQGWRCTREPGHDGPCAAVPA